MSSIGKNSRSVISTLLQEINENVDEQTKKQIEEYKKQKLKQMKLFAILKIIGISMGGIVLYFSNCLFAYYVFHQKTNGEIYGYSILAMICEILLGVIFVCIIQGIKLLWSNYIFDLENKIEEEPVDLNVIKLKKMKQILK